MKEVIRQMALADACNAIARLENENAELEKRCNELFFQVNEQVAQIEKAKELLGNWLQIAHKNHARCYGFVKDTEQFLEEN